MKESLLQKRIMKKTVKNFVKYNIEGSKLKYSTFINSIQKSKNSIWLLIGSIGSSILLTTFVPKVSLFFYSMAMFDFFGRVLPGTHSFISLLFHVILGILSLLIAMLIIPVIIGTAYSIADFIFYLQKYEKVEVKA